MSTIVGLVVDSLKYLHQNGTYSFYTRIYKDSSALDLTGKTVTATIRSVKQPGVILNAAYEDMAVTLGNTDHTAAQGGTTLSLSPSATYFWAPFYANEWEDYFVQYYVVTDDYYPARLLIHVTRVLD